VRRAFIVDLNEVTFIDKSGERLLRMLARDGAEFIASGIYTKHVLDEITAKLRERSRFETMRRGILRITWERKEKSGSINLCQANSP
jgi:hypothetical protein